LADVYFVERSHAKTPDFKIRNQYWELKSPSGNGKRTIQHTLESAKKQPLNIILDMRRSKIQGNKIINEIESGVRTVKGIRRLIVILKSGDVMSINI